MTMTIEDLIAWGRSLVFCPNSAEAKRVEAMCIRRGVPYVNSANGVNAHENYRVWDRMTLKHGALIAVAPTFAHGVRVHAHRTIWIGRVPTSHMRRLDDGCLVADPLFPLFIQAMHRVPETWEHFDPQGMTVKVESRPFAFPEGHA